MCFRPAEFLAPKNAPHVEKSSPLSQVCHYLKNALVAAPTFPR